MKATESVELLETIGRTFLTGYGHAVGAASVGYADARLERVRAGLATAHTCLAAEVFCGIPPPEAAALTERARRDLPADGLLPAYQVGRQQIVHTSETRGRC
jgi:hypothetical protein